MAKPRNIKNEILKLRREGKTYSQISSEMKCAKSVVHYHCKKHNLTDIGLQNYKISDEIANEIREYSKTHTNKDTSEKFNLSLSTIKKYKKPII